MGHDPEATEDRTEESILGAAAASGAVETIALVVVWAPSEPWRVGEALLFPPTKDRPRIFGRASASDAGVDRVQLVRQRPGENQSAAPLRLKKISRSQLRVQSIGGGRIDVENIGRGKLKIAGEPVEHAQLSLGQSLEVSGQLMLYCEKRPFMIERLRHGEVHPWGQPDEDGIVGESPATWQLRELIRFVAPRAGHVLVTGPSGAGKELVARAVHRQSERGRRQLVARNAATIPGSLMDAELFGHVKDYPNPGMADRQGLVGQADGSTLFLDEVGELPSELQAHLLRLMDGGEYQRLGESRARTSDLRIVGATNRERTELKSDFAARFRHVIDVPALAERRTDVPLLMRHLLRGALRGEERLADRFLAASDDGDHYPRVSPRLVASLLGHPLPLQVRELDAILWRCLGSSTGDVIEATEKFEQAPLPQLRETTKEELIACMDRHDGVRERVWRELGLANRYVLRRLIKKFDLGE